MKSSQKNIILLCPILLLTLLININLFKAPFIFDDYDFLFRWATIRDFENIPALLLGDTPPGHEGVYRPLRSIFYAISLRLFGHNIFFYHIQELLIYFLCIVFVYLITQKMFGKYALSFLTALFFAILPIHIDNVANLTASFDTIGVVFFFLSFYLFQHSLGAQKHQKIFFLLSLITSLAAYASYEITFILPLLMFLYAFYKNKKLSLFVYLTFTVCVAIFLLIRINILHITTRGALSDNLPRKIDNTVNSLTDYLIISLLPIETQSVTLSSTLASLSFSQAKEPVRQTNIQNSSFFLSLILLTTTIALSIKFYLKRKTSGFAFIWFYTALLPAIAISFQSALVEGNTQSLWGRYAIIASFGTSLLLANLLLIFFRFHPKSSFVQYLRISGITAITVLTIMNAAYSFKNLNYWKDPIPGLLIKIRQLKKEDDKHNDLGVVYAAQRKLNDSLIQFHLALKINPRNSNAKQNLDKLCQVIKKIKIDPKTKKSCPN